MQRLKHIVVFKEKPGGISWDKELPSRAAANAFIAEVEEAGGIAVYIEDFETDNISIGSTKQDGEDDETEATT